MLSSLCGFRFLKSLNTVDLFQIYICVWDVSCYVQVEVLYRLQLVQIVCTNCSLYKIDCTSCNLYRTSPSNKLNLYITVVQVGNYLVKLTILLKIFLSYVYQYAK